MSRYHAKLDACRWAATRGAVLRRDRYRCTACGRAGPGLEAHHEPPLRAGADPYDLDGIRTLCRACHIERHREDDMVPGRPAWLEFVAEMAGE